MRKAEKPHAALFALGEAHLLDVTREPPERLAAILRQQADRAEELPAPVLTYICPACAREAA